jgi:hypothetical protein
MVYKRGLGSFTIEAALIMPMILGVIVLFINIAFVSFDRCTMEYICRIACADAVYEDDPEIWAEEMIHKDMEKKLIRKWDTNVSVYSDDEAITATVEAKTGLFDKTYVYTATAYKHFCPKY